MKKNDLTDVLDANSHLFTGLPDAAVNMALEIFIKRYRLGINDGCIYDLLAFKLLEKSETDFPIREIFKDSPLAKLRGMSVALLGVFFPLEEVRLLVRNQDYEPKTYSSLNPQNKAVVEIAKMMLSLTSGSEILDMMAGDDQEIRKELYQPSLGKLGWAGLRSKEAAPKALAERNENYKDRNAWLIEWAKEIYEKHKGQLSASAIAAIIRNNKDKWVEAGEIESLEDVDSILSQYRIHSIIKKSLPTRKKTGV